MKCITAAILFIFFNSVVAAADTLNINQTVLPAAYPSIFNGMSSMSLNDQVLYDTSATGETISSQFSDTIYQLSKSIGIKDFRFPGGTIGNFYHYYGKGYGIDTSEINCAPGRIGYPWLNNYLRFDKRATKNLIEYFTEEIQAYKNNGENVGVTFRLNSHTHFYKGDLISFSDSIQYIINVYTNNNIALLNSNGDFFLDSTNIGFYALALYNIQQNALFKRIKDKLVRTPGFALRFKENMDAMEYLKSKTIPLLRVEIGNETDAEYIIYDDDLSYSSYDCNTNTAIDSNLANFPIKYFFEGLLKNYIVASLYADSIKARYNIPCGIPAAMRFNYLQPDSNYNPVFIKPYSLPAKLKDLWNSYFGLQPNIQAMIPHLYFQKFIPCDDYAAIPEKYAIHKLTEKFIKAYCDNSILYNLQTISTIANKKPLWVTEWNFTDKSYATGTFLHALYIYHFIRKAVEIYEQKPTLVQSWMYHLLAGAYYPWPIIKSGYDTSSRQYKAQKQITFEPFYIWSSTINKNVKKINDSIWPTSPDLITDVFVNNTKDEIYVQFVNTDSIPHTLSLSNSTLVNNNQLLSIQSANSYILQATSFTSTNYTDCSYLQQNMNENDYRVYADSLTQLDSLLLPALSMGKYTLNLKNTSITHINSSSIKNTVKTYPNPAEDEIHIQLGLENNYQNIQYKLYNLLGELISQNFIQQAHSTINTSSLSSGLYHLQLLSAGKIIDNQKIIIQ